MADRAGFLYAIFFTATIAGTTYEFDLEWRTPIQFRPGDRVHIDGLEEVKVAVVIWYIPCHNEASRSDLDAYMELEDLELEGSLEKWVYLLDTFDSVIPNFPALVDQVKEQLT